MTQREDFKERLARTRGKSRSPARSNNGETLGRQATRSVFETLFETVTDIFLYGWWAFFSGIVFFIFVVLAVLNFIGFDVEYLLAAVFLLFVGIGLAWHFFEG